MIHIPTTQHAPRARTAAVPWTTQEDPLVPTVFHEPWWLDIATRGRWAEAEVVEGGRIVGRLPYHVEPRLGGSRIAMPPLTHFLGPATRDGGGSGQARWLKRAAITRELIGKLPRTVRFRQKFHRGITDVIPFQVAGFATTMQFTFEIAPAPEAELWAALRDKHRNVIRKARTRFAVEELTDSKEFTRLYHRNLHASGQHSWVPFDIMAALIAAAVERNAGTMLGVRDAGGALAAAVFCPRDRQVCYYTLSTRRADAGNGAVPLLIWEAITRAAQDGLTFDFDGLALANTIGLYAGFGGVTSPRYVCARSLPSALMRVVRRGVGLHSNRFGA